MGKGKTVVPRAFFGRARQVRGAFACVLATLAGCSQTRFSQTHFIGVYDENNGALQIYRFDLVGKPGLTKTKFVSGWYDEGAIERLVGEKVSIGPTQEEGATDAAGRTHVQLISAGPEGALTESGNSRRRLAIIMASDPEPVTRAISALAEEEELLKQLRRRDREEKKTRAESIGRVADVLSSDPKTKPLADALQVILGASGSGNQPAPN